MLSKLLEECIDDVGKTAVVNKDIVNSIAAEHIKEIEEYMTRFLSGVFKGGSNNITFKSITKCGVHETLKQLRAGPANSLKYDVTVSDLILYNISVAFGGTTVNKYSYLPFCREAGLMKIAGSTYRLISVLSDKSLSPSANHIFARLFRDKIRFESTPYTVLKDGEPAIIKIIISSIYNPRERNKLYTKSRPGPLLYILAHYGFTEAMQRLLGWVPKIVDADYVNPDEVIFSTTGDRPAKTFLGSVYFPTKARIAIPKGCDVATVRLIVGNLFYILDHFSYVTPETWDDAGTWRVVLGKIICGVDTSPAILRTVDKHMCSLNNYVDSFMVSKLYEEYHESLDQDFTEDGFFKILIVIMQRFEQWVLAADEITASTLDKRFETLYHLLYDVIKSINSFSFDIEQKRENFGTDSAILKHFNKKVTRGRVYSIRLNNITCSPITYSGDHKYFKITSGAELQLSIPTASSSKSSSKARAVGAANATTTLHETQMYCSTQNAITMDRLSPATYLNIFAPYDPVSRTFIPTEKMLADTDQLRNILKQMTRRSSSPKIPHEFNIYSKD